MNVRVKVFPGSKKESISVGKNGVLSISVKEPAEENRANTRVRELLARHFGVTERSVRMETGRRSPTKRFIIEEN